MTALIKNLMAVVTMDGSRQVLRDADILVEGNRITKVGRGIDPPEEAEIIDGSGLVATPGLVNTHHHLYQTMFRNVPRVQDAKLFDWLVNLYEGWRHITPEDVYWAALTGLGELLLTGCTLSSDHHYLFPRGFGNEILDATVRAAAQLGIRFHPTRGSMSRGKSNGGLPPDDVCQDEETIIRQSIDFIDKYHDPSPGAMVRVALAPCSPFSVTPELMRDTARLAREKGVRLHTHLAETKDEEDYCLETLGMRPLAFMESVEWLGSDVWYAHGVWFNDDEISLLGETKTGIAHCPTSNLRLGSGIAPVPRLRAAGVPVSLAVDGSASNDSSDMLAEVRLSMMVHRIVDGVDSVTAMDSLEMATVGGARVLGWEDELGSISEGMLADIAMFDMNDISYAGGLHDPAGALVFGNSRRRAAHVMVNGRLVVRDGHLVGISEEEIVRQQNARAAAIIERASSDINLLSK